MKNLLAMMALVVLVGCATKLDPTGPYQGDRVLYNADAAIASADAVFVAFMKWEFQNRDTLKQWPEIRKTADVIRKGNRAWLATAMTARDNYKVVRNSTTETALTDAIKVITTQMLDAQKYLTP